MFDARLVKDDELRVQVLVLEGDFTMDERRVVDDLLADVTSGDYAGLVLDISGIDYIDSAGLMVVVAAFNKLDRVGKSMTVATGGNRYAEDKLNELGLLRIPKFKAFESAEEAKRALARTPGDV